MLLFCFGRGRICGFLVLLFFLSIHLFSCLFYLFFYYYCRTSIHFSSFHRCRCGKIPVTMWFIYLLCSTSRPLHSTWGCEGRTRSSVFFVPLKRTLRLPPLHSTCWTPPEWRGTGITGIIPALYSYCENPMFIFFNFCTYLVF